MGEGPEALDPILPEGHPALERGLQRRRGRRYRRRWLAPVLLVAGGAMLLVAELHDEKHEVYGGFTMGGDEVPPPGWRRGAVGPLRSRLGHTAVWTGSELVIWGGEPEGDGGAYDPVVGAWRRIAAAPFPSRAAAVADWTGFEVILWGGQSPGPPAMPLDTGAAYDAIANRWRLLPPAPLSARVPLVGVWTGREFVVVGGTSGDGTGLVDAAAYEPDTDRWRPIAPLPQPFSHAVGVWTGGELVVFGSYDDGQEASAIAAAWQPDQDRWRLLPPSPLTGRRVTGVWTGRELVAWDGDLHSASLALESGRWQPLPDVPSDPGLCDPAGVLAGEVVFAEQCGRGALFSLRRRRWDAIPHPYFLSGRPTWTGRDVMLWSGAFRGSQDSIWLYHPKSARPAGTTRQAVSLNASVRSSRPICRASLV